MTDIGTTLRGATPGVLMSRLVARPGFQDWVGRVPGLSWFSRRDGAAIFDLVQGFVRSQVLYALVELDLLRRLTRAPATADALARECDMPAQRMVILLRAGVALGLVRRCRGGRFGATRRGAAVIGVPGLQEMILHHGAFYRDLDDPLALLRGQSDTELAALWPYVFGARGQVDPQITDRYSQLMADTQALVARDTLPSVPWKDISRLLDVGGGSGAFLIEVARAHRDVGLCLLDLPAVVDAAGARIAAAGMTNRIDRIGASFRDEPLPGGYDAISLIRVLYDHGDATVGALLSACHAALPPGGRLIISEPMSGGSRPDPVTDVYFAFYTMAMRTGRTRSAQEIADLVRAAGFLQIRRPKPSRPYVTSVLTAVRGD